MWQYKIEFILIGVLLAILCECFALIESVARQDWENRRPASSVAMGVRG